MVNTALLYAPKGGNTENAAKRIQTEIGKDKVDLYNVSDLQKISFEKYKNIIIGVASISNDIWQSNIKTDEVVRLTAFLERMEWKGKTVAIFGLGNAISYPMNFVDEMGNISEILISKKAKIVGKVPREGYEFSDSKALYDGKLIGLPLDYTNEDDKTNDRIKVWVNNLKEFMIF
ncbi:MAG: flavodoxin domain-containing protein [Bacteroidales bacterium]|nr:flavodoxin domain-containing protein [Bacteroidales bacterium]